MSDSDWTLPVRKPVTEADLERATALEVRLTTFCCETMAEQLTQTCQWHDRYSCPDQIIHRWNDGRTGIHIKDGGGSMIVMNFCPWCGKDIRVAESDLSESAGPV